MTDEQKMMPCPVEITEDMVEAAAKAVAVIDNYVWPDDWSEKSQAAQREKVLAAIASALTAWNARAPAQSAGGGEARVERAAKALFSVLWGASVFAKHGEVQFENLGPADQSVYLKAARAVLTDTGGDGAAGLGNLAHRQGSRWKHVKTGGEYTIVGRCQIEATNEQAYLYKGHDGLVWARPITEFLDGRFEPLPAAPSNVGTGEAR